MMTWLYVTCFSAMLNWGICSGIQVIFPALDRRVKNVAQTYSLEHKGESNLFDHLFELLNSSGDNDESFRRELASCTGALQTSVSQHMAKEQQQVSLFNISFLDFHPIELLQKDKCKV
jgi:hypothetical protein